MHSNDAILSPILLVLILGVVIMGVGIAIMLPIHYSRVRRGIIPQTTTWSPLSIVSFVLAFLVPLAGVICGHIALSQIAKSRSRGWGFAVSALWIGYVNLIGDLLVLVALVAVAFALPALLRNINDLVINLH